MVTTMTTTANSQETQPQEISNSDICNIRHEHISRLKAPAESYNNYSKVLIITPTLGHSEGDSVWTVQWTLEVENCRMEGETSHWSRVLSL